MITVVIETHDDEVGLAHALAALVPAATEGIVREVVIIDRGSRDGTLVVADAAGCTIIDARKVVGDSRHQAAEQARGDWLLFLSPLSTLAPGWQGEALAFIDRAVVSGDGRASAATFRGGRLVVGWRARMAEWSAGFQSRLVAAPRAGEGRLISKGFYLARAGHRRSPASLSASSPASAASPASGARRGAA